MRIQAINQNNSINHKAYFKPNKEFKRIFGNSRALSPDFKKRLANLPNHEIEVLNIGSGFSGAFCTIFNNNTKILNDVNIRDPYTALEEIIISMEKYPNTFFRRYDRIDEFEEITREPKLEEDPKFPM